MDADGRITAASTGSAGSPDFVLTFAEAAASSPHTGTFTAQPGTTKIMVYAVGGGGSGGSYGSGGRSGGPGGFGVYITSVTAPYSVPYFVGSGGNIQNNGGGNSGGATGIGSPAIFQADGGGGGGVDTPGGTGSAQTTNATYNLSGPSSPGPDSTPIARTNIGFWGGPSEWTGTIGPGAEKRRRNIGVGGQGGYFPGASFCGGNGAIRFYENLVS